MRCLMLALPLATLACDEPAETEAVILPYTQSGVPWVFDGDGHQYLVDTGTPRSFVVPELAGLPSDAFTTAVIPGWSVLGVGEGTPVVITNDLPPAMVPLVGPLFGGIMAADILAQRPFVLDPWRGRIIFDEGDELRQWMRETESIVEIPVEVAGGGVTCMAPGRCFEHQGLRMLVEVELDGEPVLALVDTASTYTSMGEGLLERLGPGPAPRPELEVSRSWDRWRFTRIGRTRIGEAELDNMPVNIKPSLDVALARLSVEVNAPVELLIGHSLLLHFTAGFDYADATLTLARYATPQHVETEMFEQFGFWPVSSGGPGCFLVAAVAHDPATTQAGIDIGDCVGLAEHPAGMSFAAFDRKLRTTALGEEISFAVYDLAQPDPGALRPRPRIVTLERRDLLPELPL